MNKRWFFGRVVTPEQVIENGAVGIDGETILYAGEAERADRDPKEPTEKVSGWITPGLIDLHIHGAGGRDLMEGTPEAVQEVSRTLAAHGVTSFLATSVVCRELKQNRHLEIAAELCNGRGAGGAEILGLHVEGPYVNPSRAGLIRHDRIWPPDTRNLADLLKLGKGAFRMVTMAPELPGALDLLPVLKDSGVVGSLGHTEATFDQARAGFDGGIRHVTHLYNAMRGLHHREPGALGATLSDHGVTVQLIADGVHVHPEVLRWTFRVLGIEAIALITDALPAAGLPDGIYAYDGREYESKDGSAWQIKEGGAHGSLFGTTLLLDGMMRRAMGFMGVTFSEAVRMASLNPACALGLEKKRGRLAPGAFADIVLWDNDLRVAETFVRGQSIYRSIVVSGRG